MITYSTLPFDVVHHICSSVYRLDHKTLCNLSVANKQTRVACIPFLFEEIIFDKQWGEGDIPWDGVSDSIEVLLKQSEILNAVRSFHLQPWVRNPEGSPIPSAFFKLLFSLPNLEHVAILLQAHFHDQVKSEFGFNIEELAQSQPKLLPTVHSLRIPSPAWMFISDCSPNLTTLDITHASTTNWPSHETPELNIVQLGKTHPKLEELHCALTGFADTIKEIAHNIPRIQCLGLGGYGYREPNGIMDHIHAYSHFKHLESLSIPGPAELGMGFYPPRCGNAYFSNPGLREKVAKQSRDTVERVMRGFEAEIISGCGLPLREVMVGTKSWGSQTMWEKGDDGKLHRSKIVERSRRTTKVVKLTEVDDA